MSCTKKENSFETFVSDFMQDCVEEQSLEQVQFNVVYIILIRDETTVLSLR